MGPLTKDLSKDLSKILSNRLLISWVASRLSIVKHLLGRLLKSLYRLLIGSGAG